MRYPAIPAALAAILLFLAESVCAQTADQLSRVIILTPNRWHITVSPDGSARAILGSLPQDPIQKPPGSIDFAKLVASLKQARTTVKIEGGSQAGLTLRGETASHSTYLRTDDFLRELFSSHPDAWWDIIPIRGRGEIPDGSRFAPISPDLRRTLLQMPIFPR